MKTSQKGIDLIKTFEGCRLAAYPDPGSGGEPWTIGYGHTGGVQPGDTCTQEQADNWLAADLQKFEKCVSMYVDVAVTQEQFDALVSFAYNLGCGTLRNSTLIRKLNTGDDVGAAEEFSKWTHASGNVLNGLVARREAERQLFMEA